MPSTKASCIGKELVAVFVRVGVPDELWSDQGSNFMSALLEEVYRLLNICRFRTPPYHPQTDGLVERFNGTLKAMLKKFVNHNQKDWDDCLPHLLFAYREVPQESTGFSPFELLYGRRVRGPLDVLKETWTGYTAEEALTPVATYVLEMRDCLEEMSDLVQKGLGEAQQRQKALYDRRAKERTFEVGDQVLVLLPMQHNRLKLEWVGAYKVVKRVTPVAYEVETSRKHGIKSYHVNLLKRWYSTAEPSGACLALCPNESNDDAEEDAPAVDLYLEGDL